MSNCGEIIRPGKAHGKGSKANSSGKQSMANGKAVGFKRRQQEAVGNAPKGPKCFNCQKHGHYAKDCPEPSKKQANGSHVTSPHKVRVQHLRHKVNAVIEQATQPGPEAELDMLFAGRVAGLGAVFLLDTGATGSFIDAEFVKRNGLRVQPYHTNVEVADGSIVSPLGMVQVQLRLGKIIEKTRLVVMNLAPGFEVILGSPWLKAHSAQLDLVSSSCVLKSGSVAFKLGGERIEDRSRPSLLLSGTQYFRAIRRGCTAFLGVVRGVSPETSDQVIVSDQMSRDAPDISETLNDATHEPVHDGVHNNSQSHNNDENVDGTDQGWNESNDTGTNTGQSNQRSGTRPDECMHGHDSDMLDAEEDDLAEAMTRLSAEVQGLISSYKDVFPAEMPAGLPPDRDCFHAIPLVGDAEPPFRPLYRLSPFEVGEMRQQISGLLKEGGVLLSQCFDAGPICRQSH